MLIKVTRHRRRSGSEIVLLVEMFRGRVVDISHDERDDRDQRDQEGKIEAFIELMRPYGILELARTGRIALVRGTPDGEGRDMSTPRARITSSDPPARRRAVDVLKRAPKPGQRIRVTQTVRVGGRKWQATAEGAFRESTTWPPASRPTG